MTLTTEPHYRLTAVYARSLSAVPHLEAFLPESRSIVRGCARLTRRVDSVAGFGMTAASLRARRIAERRGLPYLALDDGFVRSLGPAADGFATMSLIVDPEGIYYDATRPSRLERMLEEPTPIDVGEAAAAVARLRAERISWLNHAPPFGDGDVDPGVRPLVVVVDQVAGDPSIALGLAGERQFHDMLDAAIDEHPDAVVLVKLHPEVVAGRATGFLAERARRLGLTVLAHDIEPLSLVERAERVYTVTSRLGMEALICGTPVTCFGMPYYAGWGATDDRAACARRTRRRSALEIFAAAYLRYSRYLDPLTGSRAGLDLVLQRLAVMKRAHERQRGHHEVLGFPRHKRRLIETFLGDPGCSTGFAKTSAHAVREAAARRGRVGVWAAAEPLDLAERARRSAVPVVRVADGILPSIGRDHESVAGTSLVFDRRGIHFDPSQLSELEEMLEFEHFDAATLAQAAALRGRLLAFGAATRSRSAPFGFESDPRIKLLVLGEAEDDPAVQRGGGGIATNLGLLRAVRAKRPEALLVYSPHPEVEAGRRPGRVPETAAGRLCDVVLWSASARDAIDAVDEVHCLTSLLGFEALLRGRTVVTHGGPFYAGWGLTRDRLRLPRRTRALTIEQLVAGALIRYPTYRDPETGLACDVLTLIDRLAGRPTPPVEDFRDIRRLLQVRPVLRQLLPAPRAAA